MEQGFFEKLDQSLEEAVSISRGEMEPSRVSVAESDIEE